MSLVSTQNEFSKHLALTILHLQTIGYVVTLGEVYRTEEQQAIYVKKKLSKTMNSRHRHRLAADILLHKDGVYLTNRDDYKALADFWTSLHPDNVAGYAWGWDSQHIERKPPATPPKKS